MCHDYGSLIPGTATLCADCGANTPASLPLRLSKAQHSAMSEAAARFSHERKGRRFRACVRLRYNAIPASSLRFQVTWPSRE
jgi:hypothetical protein